MPFGQGFSSRGESFESVTFDRKIRILIRGKHTIVRGNVIPGDFVHDQRHWAHRKTFDQSYKLEDYGDVPDIETAWIIRSFRYREEEGDPLILPVASGKKILVIDTENRLYTINTIKEIGRNRYLEIQAHAPGLYSRTSEERELRYSN